MFFSHHINVKSEAASNIVPVDFVNNNIVYVESHRFAGLFKQYLYFSPFEYSYYPDEMVTYTPHNSDSTITYAKAGGVNKFHTDYVIVAKIPGPNKNNIMLAFSFFSTGTARVIKDMTQQTSLNRMKEAIVKDIGYVPNYFEILIKVTGFKRIGYNSKIILVRELTSEMNIWGPYPAK
jgi:hypothetical protein